MVFTINGFKIKDSEKIPSIVDVWQCSMLHASIAHHMFSVADIVEAVISNTLICSSIFFHTILASYTIAGVFFLFNMQCCSNSLIMVALELLQVALLKVI